MTPPDSAPSRDVDGRPLNDDELAGLRADLDRRPAGYVTGSPLGWIVRLLATIDALRAQPVPEPFRPDYGWTDTCPHEGDEACPDGDDGCRCECHAVGSRAQPVPDAAVGDVPYEDRGSSAAAGSNVHSPHPDALRGPDDWRGKWDAFGSFRERIAYLETFFPNLLTFLAASHPVREGAWSFEGLTGDGWAIIGPDDEERHGGWAADGYGRAIALDRADAERIVAALNEHPVREGGALDRNALHEAIRKGFFLDTLSIYTTERVIEEYRALAAPSRPPESGS